MTAPGAPQHKAYGPLSPVYADPAVGGVAYPHPAARPALRHVHDLGDGTLFIEGRSAPAPDGFTLASPPARPSLWSRLLGKLRRPR
jgi:hypothetical protein